MITTVARLMGRAVAYFKADPSAEWPPHSAIIPILDLTVMTFHHIPIGADPTVLRVFGKASNPKPFWHGRFEYRESCFEIIIENERVASFVVIFAAERSAPAALEIIAPATEVVRLPAHASLRDVTAVLGPPTDRTAAIDREIHHYYLGKHKLDIECSDSGAVSRILFTRNKNR